MLQAFHAEPLFHGTLNFPLLHRARIGTGGKPPHSDRAQNRRQGDTPISPSILGTMYPVIELSALIFETRYKVFMSKDWKTPVAPRNLEAQEASIRVLDKLSKMAPGTENVERACKEVVRGYERTEGKCPVVFGTLRKYADVGIVVVGVPELAKPFLEVAVLVRSGELDLKTLGGGGMDLMIREGALNQACELARGIMDMPGAKDNFADNLPQLNSLIKNLGDVSRPAKGSGKQADVFELVEGINEEEAMRVIGVIFRRFPKIGAALAGGKE